MVFGRVTFYFYQHICLGCRIGAMTPFTAPGNATRECQRASMFFSSATIIIQGAKPVVGAKLLPQAKLIFNTPDMLYIIMFYLYHCYSVQ